LTANLAFEVSHDQIATKLVEYSIDNVGFFKGTPPTDPPMPGP
jgi:hypothetical protein